MLTQITRTNFLSFELLFTLFLFAGQYKAAERFSWIPVDLTALLFAVTLIWGTVLLAKNRFTFKKSNLFLIGLVGVFNLYILASLFWSPGYVYSSQKAFYISTLVFWSFFAPCAIISPSRLRLNRLFLSLVLLAAWFSVEAILFLLTHSSGGFVTVLGSNYLGLSRILGIGSIITLVHLLYLNESVLLRLILAILSATFIAILLVAGGRGPLLSLFIAGLSLLPLNFRFSVNLGFVLKRRLAYVFLMAAFAISLVFYQIATGKMTTTLSRLLVLFQPGGGNSASARIEYFMSSFHIWATNPLFGHGIGSWPVLFGDGDVRNYPHNIVLEILSELGIIGLVLFTAIVAFALATLSHGRAIREDPMKITLLALFIYAFVNACISGDISDNRFLFTTIGCMGFPKDYEHRQKNDP